MTGVRPTGNGMLLIVTVFLFAFGCDDSKPKTPTAPTPSPALFPSSVPVDLSGAWVGAPMWVLNVLRTRDNFSIQFHCNGTMVITQSPGPWAIRGFMLSSGPCDELVSFELAGTFAWDGRVTFKSDGPRPPQGPCPGGKDIEFTGRFNNDNRLLVTGRTRVQCPEFGEHIFTYIVTANR